MQRIKDKEMHKEELNFLKEELKKTDNMMKGNDCNTREKVENQLQLWELREKIMEEVNKFLEIYYAT